MKSVYRCENCGFERLAVIDSRKREDGLIYRRRKCMDCGWKTSSYEMPAEYIGLFDRCQELKNALTSIQNVITELESGEDYEYKENSSNNLDVINSMQHESHCCGTVGRI